MPDRRQRPRSGSKGAPVRIFAIDPGTTQSGWVIYEAGKVLAAGVALNGDVMEMVENAAINPEIDYLAIEMIASYGMPVGDSTFRTVWWTGRFAHEWERGRGCLPVEVVRQEVKLHVCKSNKANDGTIRVALMDLIGPKGTKANPGPTFGVSSHAWQALGVAVTAENKLQNPCA